MPTTKNLELYFQHAPTANLTTLAALSTIGMVNGVMIEVASDGLFTFQTPAVAIPTARDVIAGNGGGVWIRQTLPALTTTTDGAITIAKGGTGEITQQAAIDNLAGGVTSTYYLRGNGTHAVMSAIQASDVPTLNQDTSGTADKATNIVGGDVNYIPYQTDTDETDFITAAASSVLVTDGTNVPSLSTTLPAVAIGTCTCTDPTTSTSASIDTALLDVYNGKETVFNGVEDASLFAITYDSATRVFSVTYTTGAAWTVNGVRYTHVAGTVTTTAHDDVTASYYLYYNSSGILTVSDVIWDLLTQTPIASIYYNTSNNGGGADAILQYEIHAGNAGMANATHKYLNDTRGTQFLSGCVASGYTLNVGGNTNVNWATTQGYIVDEDITWTVSPQALGGSNTYRILWLTGITASPVWNWLDSANYGILDDTTDIYYNKNNAGTWEQTAISSNSNWVNYWIVSTTAYNTPQIVVVMGQKLYIRAEDAESATFASDISNFGLFTNEAVILYRITYERINTAGAPGNAVISSFNQVIQNLITNNIENATTASNVKVSTDTFTNFFSPDDVNVQQVLNDLDANILGINITGIAATATNIAGGATNYIPYQSNTDTTGFISSAVSSVLVTDGSSVPSLSTTLPAVEAGLCTCTDPTTSSSASVNTALSNVYSAIVPPLEYDANVSSFGLSVAVATPQIITGAQIILPSGKYLLSYSSSQTFTPTATNIGAGFSATTFIYNTTGAVNISNTSFTALNGYTVAGSEIFGGTASATVITTFSVTTTLDIYTQLNSVAVAGATFSADETIITAIRLANTQTVYSANGILSADSTSTSPQIVTGAELILPAGNYLLTYSASQNLTTQVADASTAFVAKSYIYNTTDIAIVPNTEYISFSGFATTGAEIFGGTSSVTVAVTLAVTTTLDVYIQLSAASAGTDTYSIVSEITAVKLD